MLDQAKTAFDDIISEISSRLHHIENEADTRFQVIDRVLTEVLMWKREEIRVEPPTDRGYLDYLCKVGNRNVLVVEAKRTGFKLIDTESTKATSYKVGGAALKSAKEGVHQAMTYCLEQGVSLAILTNGISWIGFVAVGGEGRPPLEGQAFVFPSFESIQLDFASFYDLFSREGVLEKRYKIKFRQLEGLSVVHSGPVFQTIADDRVRFLSKNELATNLEPVFNNFFSTISGEKDPEILINCFVDTKESREADSALEKISRDLISHVESMGASQGELLAKELEVAVETHHGEVVLIIGNKGAGKSTFIDKFFQNTLQKSLREQCLVIRVDLANSHSGQHNPHTWDVAGWATKEIIKAIEAQYFKGRTPTYDELQGIFFSDYQRWSIGEFQHLYETDHDAFKIKFGEFMYAEAKNEPYAYTMRLLKNAVSSRKLLPCLIFDNTDQFPQSVQEAVFQFAQAIYRSVLTFLIVPITDRTLWQLSKAGPLQSYSSKAFYLPVPSTKDILERRVDFIKRKISEDRTKAGQYFLSKGIRLSIANIEAFAACLEEAFITTDFTGRRISWLANHDIRRSLQIAHRIVMSPSMNIEQVVKAYLAKQAADIPPYKIMLSIILGNYNYFQKTESSFLSNVFDVEVGDVASPLLKLSILQLLVDNDDAASDLPDSYVSLEDIQNYFEPMGVPSWTVAAAFRQLMVTRLIEPYDPSDDRVGSFQRARITYSGRMHGEFAVQDQTYVSQMALRTGVLKSEVAEQIKRAYINKTVGPRDWLSVIQTFISYCLDEDSAFMKVPAHNNYKGQQQLRRQLTLRWTNRNIY